MKSPHPAFIPVEELIKQCKFTRTRRGGPGGQHRNKVETAVVVEYEPTGTSANASERRSQHANRTVAIERLRINLAIAVRTEPDDQPSELWRSRCKSRKLSISPNHEDFPAILAEALNHIFATELQIAKAAEVLECSTSQLIKLVRMESAAWTMLNQKRIDAGMSTLKS